MISYFIIITLSRNLQSALVHNRVVKNPTKKYNQYIFIA